MEKANTRLGRTIDGFNRFRWKYKNLILLGISIILAFYILKSGYFHATISKLGSLGYVGCFVAGVFFPYGLTAAPAMAVFYVLGEVLNPLLIASIAALGSAVSDYLIFRFVRDRLMDEIKTLAREINNLTKPVSSLVFSEEIRVIIWQKVSQSRVWKVILPILAGFIVASPLPDEIGAALFGAVKFESKKFILLTYCLNFIGIFALTSLAKVL